MKLLDVFNKNTIKIVDQINTKEELIKLLISNVDKSNLFDENKAFEDVLAREKVMSTGVGKGIALPHAKTEAVKACCGSLVLLKNPVDYQSLDSKPVLLSCLLLSQTTNIGLHLKMLSSISKLLNNDSIRNNLFESSSEKDIISIIEEFESESISA